MDLIDTRVLKYMEFLQSNNMTTYINFKKNLEAACMMHLIHDAETTFRAKDFQKYNCLCLLEIANADFAIYTGMQYLPGRQFFLHIRQDLPFMLVAAVDENGYIVEKKHVSREEKIQDLQYTFIDYLYPVSSSAALAVETTNNISLTRRHA